MTQLLFYRFEKTFGHWALETHLDRRGDYDRAIKGTWHDIDVARIHLLNQKQGADAVLSKSIRHLEDLKAMYQDIKDFNTKSRVSGTWSNAYESDMAQSIKREKDNVAIQKENLERHIDTAKGWVDKLVQQLTDLQKRQQKRDEQWKRLVLIDRFEPRP